MSTMMAPRQILLIVLAFLVITETSTSSFSYNKWRPCLGLPTLSNGQVTRNGWNEIVYECSPGFRLTATADCRRVNSWTPSVTCEECVALTNTQVLNNRTAIFAVTEADCTQACDVDPDCNISVFFSNFCDFYPSPFIAVLIRPTLQDCINECDSNADCQLLEYTPFSVCSLFSTDSLASLTTRTAANYTLLGKNCQCFL